LGFANILSMLGQIDHGIEWLSHKPPSVPDLTVFAPSDLKQFRQLFIQNRYSEEPSPDDEIGASVFKMLFARKLSVDADLARFVFQPMDINSLIEVGLLLKEDHGNIKARFQAQPYKGLIFFSDFVEWEDAPDFVLSIGLAAHYLALLTIRRKTESALDLGCGCGIHALLAAQHSTRVTATDINPRALALTRLNASLNGFRNIETLEGGYLDPLEARQFDLIVGNLPYVITPSRQFIYRDTDREGDAGIYHWLDAIPAHLNEGGFAQILINWIHSDMDDWSEPMRQALDKRGVDAWLIQNENKTPAEYSDSWIDHRVRRNTSNFRRTRQTWIEWYKARNIAHIALGALTLRRRSPQSGKTNWFEAAEVKSTVNDTASEQYLRLFAVRDWLEACNDPKTFLHERLHQFEMKSAVNGPSENLIGYAAKGLRLEKEIHQATAAILERLDGKKALQTFINREVQPNLQNQVIQEIKSMIRLGMVLPSSFRTIETLKTKR